MVELRGVIQRAGGATILSDVSLRFRPSAFNVVLGPNGAGKSTLLKLATGLVRPSEGWVLYDDRDVSSIASEELARTRAVLSQHVELAFSLPAEDVVMMGRYPHFGRVPTTYDREIVDRALETVGMVERRKQPYPTLSGGERQKIQLARVLAQIWRADENGGNASVPPRHRYLFLDEPTNSLDVHYQLHLLDVARDLVAHDCTVIAVLHDLNVAFRYADHVVLLERGRIAAEAARGEELPAALLSRVFQVNARRAHDAETGEGWWVFG